MAPFTKVGSAPKLDLFCNWPKLLEIGVLPVDRETRLEAILVVEGNQVGGVRQPRDRKMARAERFGVVGAVGAHQGAVRLEAEAGVGEHVLEREFDAVDVGRSDR